MKNFKLEGNDGDTLTYIRTFSGRITKYRYKLIHRWIREHTLGHIPHCGHEYDCCGCLCRQYVNFTYKYNLVTITMIQGFNY